VLTGTMQGRKYRAVVRDQRGAAIEELTLLPLDEDRVIVRTQAAQCTYSNLNQILGNQPLRQGQAPFITGQGGVGIVEAVGSRVRRVQVGDRVLVPDGPYCGQCYMCLRGRPDRCMMTTGTGENPMVPVARRSSGEPVAQWINSGGFSELMVPNEWYCIPMFDNVTPAIELAMLVETSCVGLGTVFGAAPVEPGTDVVVFGCGPVGLGAIQGARIKGASQIIAVEPIGYRRDVALKVGATMALDPGEYYSNATTEPENVNPFFVERDELVRKLRELCRGPTDRRLAGGRPGDLNRNNAGPDYVIEAVGGDLFPPKHPGPDPTGILSLRQAWALCSAAGHLSTVSVSQKGNFVLPGNAWSNASKNHHPGTHNGLSTLRDLPRFARLIRTGQFNAKALATSTYTLDQFREAHQQVADRTTIAAIIVFG